MTILSTADLNRLARMTSGVAQEHLNNRNELTREHVALVDAMSKAIIYLASGRILGRHAIAAPVGAGKTTVVKAAIKILADHTADTSLLVLQERINAGRETIRELLDMGVSEKLIGHVHSEQGGMDTSSVSTRRFVFADPRPVEAGEYPGALALPQERWAGSSTSHGSG